MDGSNMSRMINHLRINDTVHCNHSWWSSNCILVPPPEEEQDSSDHCSVLMMCIDGYTAPNSLDKVGFTTPHVSPFPSSPVPHVSLLPPGRTLFRTRMDRNRCIYKSSEHLLYIVVFAMTSLQTKENGRNSLRALFSFVIDRPSSVRGGVLSPSHHLAPTNFYSRKVRVSHDTARTNMAVGPCPSG